MHIAPFANRRILLVDDMPSIHEDYRKVLSGNAASDALDDMEASLFGGGQQTSSEGFELDSAYQGQEALEKVIAALEQHQPYAVAFVDMRMPPGWSGVETIEQLWLKDPRLQVVICTAYSDESWDEVFRRLNVKDRLLVLKKPFDPVEVLQLAEALTAKWNMTQQAMMKMATLEELVEQRTAELRKTNESLHSEIEKRQSAEAQLKLAASVFHNASDGVLIVDTAARVVSVNPAYTTITGFDSITSVGTIPELLRSEPSAPDLNMKVWEQLTLEGRWEGEIWSRRKNGESFLARLSFGVVAGQDGLPVRYVGVLNDVTESRRKDEHIRHMAFHDSLTGLPNRAYLLDRLERLIPQAEREQRMLAVLFIDLDRFKAINDSYGHNVGDMLLKEVAQRLRHTLRDSDVVARMGGDEFVVLLDPVNSLEACSKVAEKVIRCLSEQVAVGELTLQVGVSVGIASYPNDGTTGSELMKHADAAMYAAKADGRGNYRMFQASMTDRVVYRLQMEMELRKALRNNEFELFYQPKVWLENSAPCGVEALLRWRNPRLGMVSPADFIPLAEEIGLINDIGDWVMEEACRRMQVWQAQGFANMRVAVNVSAQQLQRGSLVERIRELTQQYSVSPACLEVELTESVVMTNPQFTIEQFASLRELGVTVAVDDFGTGYSSLSYLRRLPIDVLKIDRSFVMNADRSEGDAEIVKVIMGLADSLNLKVVAEGLETQAQIDFLRACGCPIGQGYFYSKPLPVGQIEPWLQSHQPKSATLPLAHTG